MTIDSVVDLTQTALYLIIKTAAPLLLISLVIGLFVSVIQTVTSIQEQTLTFVPKIVCVFLGIMIFGNWILTEIVEYMTMLWSGFSLYVK